jgi:hypothetical protein
VVFSRKLMPEGGIMKRFKMLLVCVSALCFLLPAILFATSVVFDNKMWVMGGNRNPPFQYLNDVWYSTDGVNWTQATANAGWSARDGHTLVVFHDTMWMMGGYDASGQKNDVWYSTNGVNWTQATANAGWSVRDGHTSVVFDNKMWVIGGISAGGYRNDVWYSSDGVSWTQATANAGWSARFAHTSVVSDNKMWVMGGYNSGGYKNDVWYSSDGVNWTQATANAGWSARWFPTSAVFDNKIWVIGGYFTNDIWYSTDGVNWTQATASAGWSARQTHTSVVYDNKMWVMGGADIMRNYKNDVWYSSGKGDMDWIQATASAGWSGRYLHASVVFDNKIWVIGGIASATGRRNDVWYSTNGVNWAQATASAGWSARYGHTSVVFDNKFWVIGGYDGSHKRDVWYSSDGINWTQATANAGWSGRLHHTSVVFDNKMWVIGGMVGNGMWIRDVWYSSNGINWTQATASAGWSARFSHTSVVFDNKMWVMGGYDGNHKNDVWYSSDGVNWIQATANAGWSAMRHHISDVFDNKMWVMSGIDGGGVYRNDVWYSSDGVNWTQATANAGWSVRACPTSVVFDNKMWVMGGNDGTVNDKNDVWYSEGITLLLPNGSESWSSGSNQNIKWRTSWWCSGFARYRLLLSRDGGSNYTDTIANNVASTESTYNWFVPVVKSSACRVMVQALDLTGSVIIQDASDANFTIQTTDVSVDSIIQPADSVNNRTSFYPIILVGNNSFPTLNETCTLSVKIWRFRVKYDSFCNISVNLHDSVIVFDTFKIITINPGQTRESIPAWRPVYGDLYWLSSPTYHRVRATVRMTADGVPSNDSKRKKFIVKPRKYDLQVNYNALLRGRILAPDTLSVGFAYNTMAAISNSPAGPTASFRLWCKVIKVKTNIPWYSQYIDRTLNPKTYVCLSTSSGWVPSDTGLYRFYCYIEMRPGVDSTPENNSLERFYYVRRQPPNPPQGDVASLPQVFGLMQNNPNPFHDVTSIRWQIPLESRVIISIYDATGRNIKTLVNSKFVPGYYNTTWNCTDNKSHKIASGIYFLRYVDNTNQKEIKLIVE